LSADNIQLAYEGISRIRAIIAKTGNVHVYLTEKEIKIA